ncbi:phage portal protein [Isoptericola aurantiacus]|uniref:phage portal protein n=1 Tax=Isoptericola aurantiacus TaxID=3377839 RepID=UPI003839D17C
MSIFFKRAEARSVDDLPWSAGGSAASTGAYSLGLIPLYSATTGIADDVAVTPWHAYQRGEQMAVAPELLRSPAYGIDFITWMQQAVMSALLRGYAFGMVVARDRAGLPAKVIWVDPDRVEIDDTNLARPLFRVDGRALDEHDVIYVPGPTLPGSIVGLSPVALFRLQITKGINAQRYAAEFYDRGIMPPGVLRNKARVLPPGSSDKAKKWFKESVSGRDILVTGNDWEWSPLEVPKDDAAFLATIKASATEIAAIYRVAPEDIGGETGSSNTYNTVELNELKRNRRALMPWVRRFEAALTAALDPFGVTGVYVKANMDALVRADLRTRMLSHAVALKSGVERLDEARELEDRPALTDEQVEQWQQWYSPATNTSGLDAGGTDPDREASS